MKIKVFNSGSEGNGYAVMAENEILLIEAGVPAKEMLKGISFKTADVCGCICSHSHYDHLKYTNDYFKYGFPVFMSAESRPANLPEIATLTRMKKQMIGNFGVVPFKVPHNETECDGFLICHSEIGKLLFITDAEMCPYDMSNVGINHLLIECNYSLDYVDMTDENTSHILLGHMELQTCKRFIRTDYNDNLKTIGLIHLSKKNGDPERFRKEIQCEFPLSKVWIANKNTTLEAE